MDPHVLIIDFHAETPSGISLLKNLERALAWGKTQRAVATNASKTLPDDTLADWNKMRQEFDRDPTKPNPYEEPETCKYLDSLILPHANLRSRYDGIFETTTR